MPADQPTLRRDATPILSPAVALIDRDLRVREATAAFAAVAGLAMEGLAGLEATALLPGATPPLAPLLSAVLAGGEPIQNLELKGPAGERWLASIQPIGSRVGAILGADLSLSRYDGQPAADMSLAPGGAGVHISEAVLRRLADNATFGVLIGRRDGTTYYANAELRRMLGYDADFFPPTWMAITAPGYEQRDSAAVAELKRVGVCQPYEKEYLTRDGSRLPVLVGAAAIDGSNFPDDRLVAAFVTDLSLLKQAEAARIQAYRTAEHLRQEAERAARQMERLQALTAALSRALTPEGVAGVALESGLAAMGAGAGVVMQLDASGATMSVLAAQGFAEADVSRWKQVSLTTATPITDAARRGEPVWLEDLAARERMYPHLAREFPYAQESSWAALPLSVNQLVIGALGLQFAKARAFDAEARSFLATVADLCAQALERARLTAAERAALAAADEALALLDTVIDSAPIGLAFMDAEFRYRRINATLAQINGRPAADHIGRRARDLFPSGAAVWEPFWRQVIETGKPIVGLEIGGPAMAMDRYALVDYYPVRGAGGEMLGVGIIVQDVTGRRQAEEERLRLLNSERAAREAEQAARARAEDAVRLRDAFLSVAAHELKTPLTSLIGQAQLLRRRLDQAGALTEANQRSLGVVIGQAQRLNQLINDLLDGARLEAGQLIVNRSPLDLGRLLRRVADDLQPSLVRHQLTVTIAEEPLVVAGDAIRLEQVVQNLLNNAVKYSPNGGPIVLRAGRDDDEALISVSDRGIGIEPEAIPRLFERFYRAPGAEQARVTGVGVGLYVVREIVHQHGGSVTVESTLGQGSAFLVRLPLGGDG